MNIVDPKLTFAWELTRRNTTTHLILHHAGAVDVTIEAIHKYHLSKGWAGIAYHYFITKEGIIYTGRPENTIGGHTTNWNYCSIGICFEGDFTIETMPKEQLIAGQELVDMLRIKYPYIIIGKHSSYGNTACPGNNFPFDDIVSPLVTEPIETNVEEKDVPSEWAKEACQKAINNKTIIGDGNGKYNWKEPVTLEKLLVILERRQIL